MQVQGLLHRLLKNALPEVHLKRFNMLTHAVEALLKGKRLTLTGLARSMPSTAKERHCIRKVDRLLANQKLHQEQEVFYKAISALIMNGIENPVINVDWSCVNKRKDWHILRASTSLRGRSIAIYQEVHPKGNENSPRAQAGFIKKLKEILPQGIKPIIVTDAGFRGPWFRELEKQGFEWIGRIRNQTAYLAEDKQWYLSFDLYSKATKKVQMLGKVMLSKRTPLKCTLVLYKKIKRGRQHINLSGNRSNNNQSNRCARRETDPWLLATSLEINNEAQAKKVVEIYQKRMQIEEDFRDTKSHQYGFSLRYSRTNDAKRLQTLLLIGVIASLVCWLMSLAARRKNLHLDYQANSIKTSTILSAIYLGCQLMRRKVRFRYSELIKSLEELKNIIQMNGEYLC